MVGSGLGEDVRESEELSGGKRAGVGRGADVAVEGDEVAG